MDFQPWMSLASIISPVVMVLIFWITVSREGRKDREEHIRWRANMDGWRQTVDSRLDSIEKDLREIRTAVLFRGPKEQDG